LLIEKSTAKTELEIGSENCIAADSEINSQTMSLPIQKPAIKNYIAADSKIESQTMLLPNEKSTAKLCCC
jgi:hypothetical protein